jgi:hypothetical protein
MIDSFVLSFKFFVQGRSLCDSKDNRQFSSLNYKNVKMERGRQHVN